MRVSASLHERSRERTRLSTLPRERSNKEWQRKCCSLSRTHTFNTHRPLPLLSHANVASSFHTNTPARWVTRTLTFSRQQSERARGFTRARALRSARQLLSHTADTQTHANKKKPASLLKWEKKTKMRTTKSNPKRNHSYIFSYIHIVKYKNKRKGKQ